MPRRTPIMNFLRTDGGLTFLLFSLILFIFVLFPVSEFFGKPAKYALSLSFALVLVASAVAVADRQGVRALGIVMVLATLAAHWYNEWAQGLWSRIVADALVGLFMVFTIGVLLSRVFKPGRITYHRIAGAISAYLLVGMLWAEIYGLIEFAIPGSFHVGGSPITDHAEFSGVLLYYSFVTLTTLGYGDVTPTNILSRQISVLEAVVGVLFLATLISRLISEFRGNTA